MKILICTSPDDAADIAAQVIARTVVATPDCTLGLATGRTMEAIYARLVMRHRAGDLDFARCGSFNLDEYVGVAPESPNSYRFYMQDHLFGHVNIDAARTHVPAGVGSDLRAAAEAYEAAILQAGGIDLQLLGLGENGHIGFNEPLSALRSRTRVVTLDEATRVQNAGMFGGDPALVPTQAVTMGVGTILDARSVLMVATGDGKAEAVRQMIEGPVTAMVSGSALQFHEDCLVILDEASAAGLSQRAMIAYQMQHDPDLRFLVAGAIG